MRDRTNVTVQELSPPPLPLPDEVAGQPGSLEPSPPLRWEDELMLQANRNTALRARGKLAALSGASAAARVACDLAVRECALVDLLMRAQGILGVRLQDELGPSASITAEPLIRSAHDIEIACSERMMRGNETALAVVLREASAYPPAVLQVDVVSPLARAISIHDLRPLCPTGDGPWNVSVGVVGGGEIRRESVSVVRRPAEGTDVLLECPRCHQSCELLLDRLSCGPRCLACIERESGDLAAVEAPWREADVLENKLMLLACKRGKLGPRRLLKCQALVQQIIDLDVERIRSLGIISEGVLQRLGMPEFVQ